MHMQCVPQVCKGLAIATELHPACRVHTPFKKLSPMLAMLVYVWSWKLMSRDVQGSCLLAPAGRLGAELKAKASMNGKVC